MSGAIPMMDGVGVGGARPSEVFYRRPDLDEGIESHTFLSVSLTPNCPPPLSASGPTFTLPSSCAVAVENVRKKLESEKEERDIQFKDHKTERERSRMFLESRKEEREMLERRAGVCREVDGSIYVRSDLPPSRSIGGAMRSRQTLTSESMSRGDTMFDDDGMQPIRQQDLEALESQERMFGPEAYHRFQQQIFRELEMSRLADSAFNRESLESRMGTLYQRKKMMERSQIMKEEQEKERRKDMVTEDVEVSLMEISALDDVLYSKIKMERKKQEREHKERMKNKKNRKAHEREKEKEK
jgi:hypothetical protein